MGTSPRKNKLNDMKNYNYYKTFTTGLIDGILIREDKKVPAHTAEYYDHGRKVEGYKYYQETSLRRMLNASKTLKKHMEHRDGITTEGLVIKNNIDTCVYDYLCKLELKPSFGNDIDYTYEFAPPFTDTVNKMLLILKWVAGIQSITKSNQITITKEELSEIGLNMSPLDLHKAIKAIFKDAAFSKNVYNHDERYVVLGVGGRDLQVSEGYGYVNLKMTQYTGLLNAIIAHHEKLLNERDK